MMQRTPAAGTNRKAYRNVVLPLFLVSVIAYIDRVNIGYAALTMNRDLGFDARVFGLGAGIFFAGYLLFEIPGALIAERYGPRLWLARIMITWGLISALMAFMRTAWQHSIRINDQWRVCFRWETDGVYDVEIVDYHWIGGSR